MYVDHDGQGIEDWFGSEIEEEDGDDSCIDGGENEDEIDNLTDVDVDFNEGIVTMNRIKGDECLNRLCGKEEEGNDNNIDDDDGHEEDANFEVRGTTDAYEVDLEERTCSCRLWQLNGIGCVHSVAVISFMNRDVESYVDKMFSSITYIKAYKFRLAPMNGSNLWPATDYTPPLPPVRRTIPGRPATKRKRDATETPNQSRKKSKKTTQTQNKGKEQVKVSKAGKKQKCSLSEALNEDDEGNQANAMNEGDEVNEGDQAANDDGGAVNDGGEAVNEVHVQQDYDEVELNPLEFDASANGEPSQVHVQEQEARETPLATLLKKIRRKKSERIIKLKLGKKVGGADAPGNSEAKPVTLE
ncbi:unnamed protein product [Lactuca virosa]|uniref:SWIM-type domain-containing protein n=1 Tax=Lactuca virosa TaxID=75947 RepID=A0AAU9PKU2_9ASTR|nr:unnamed protein product [Lactuca virosa]